LDPSSFFSHQIDQLKGLVMAKGYWIVSVDVSNPESYKLYIAENRNAFRKYGARFLIRGGEHAHCGHRISRTTQPHLSAITHPSTPKQLKSVRAVLWLTSLSLMAITVRSQRTGKRRDAQLLLAQWILGIAVDYGA
jgi:uncharacterized protein DUF1330